ncbi:MAG: 16S rRNA (guanine(966)-N(2))-methyltransferase RsmD [Rhodospirillaceae bacterium]|nr:16S rRNA (guanine(966)-N(2))-methyltransferase RsmD [Rhodospirillaceae bacterium]
MRIIGGIRRGKKLVLPQGSITRPTSERNREAIFNILMHHSFDAIPIKESKILDLFSGTGALGLEALSRGARKLIAIEVNNDAIDCISTNIKSLGFTDKAKVIKADVCKLRVARNDEKGCSFVFIDPPYGENLAHIAINQVSYGGWLNSRAIIIIELSTKVLFSQPKGFTLIDKRVYGKTQILFLQAPANIN